MTVLHAEKFLVEEKSKDDEEDLAESFSELYKKHWPFGKGLSLRERLGVMLALLISHVLSILFFLGLILMAVLALSVIVAIIAIPVGLGLGLIVYLVGLAV